MKIYANIFDKYNVGYNEFIFIVEEIFLKIEVIGQAIAQLFSTVICVSLHSFIHYPESDNLTRKPARQQWKNELWTFILELDILQRCRFKLDVQGRLISDDYYFVPVKLSWRHNFWLRCNVLPELSWEKWYYTFLQEHWNICYDFVSSQNTDPTTHDTSIMISSKFKTHSTTIKHFSALCQCNY